MHKSIFLDNLSTEEISTLVEDIHLRDSSDQQVRSLDSGKNRPARGFGNPLERRRT